MHLALYRKWRSRDFDDIAGQQHITSTLKYEVANNLVSHAYLFSGPRGIGKTSCAKILSRAVNCEHPVNGNPCNECRSCRSILSGSAVDVVEMDAASNNGVDNIRDIRDEVMFTPAELRYRVYIVDEVHMLSPSAFNALLKTLEEPPMHVIFILATTELHKLPETVVSRCQRFEFHRLTASVIADRLSTIAEAEGFDATRGALEEIARIADGGMRDAISHLELCAGRHTKIDEALVADVFGRLGYERVASTARAVAERDYDAIFSTVSELSAAGRDISVFWDELSSFYRDMLVIKSAREPERFLDLSESSMRALVDTSALYNMNGLLYQCRLLDTAAAEMARKSKSKRLCAEMTLIRMCSPELSSDPDALSARIASLEDKLALLEAGGGADMIAKRSNKQPDKKPKSPDPEPPKDAVIAAGDDADAPFVREELPYFGELISRAVEKNPFIEGFRRFIKGYRTKDGFELECDNPFTENICVDNKTMLTELLSIFEHRIVSDGEVKVVTAQAKTGRERADLDNL